MTGHRVNRIIGIDVGGTKIAFMLSEYGEEFRVISQCRIDTEAARGKSHIISRIFSTIDRMLEEEKLTAEQISGIGIALPGPVDIDRGFSFECPNLRDWKNVDIRGILDKQYGTYVFAENDARSAAIGEAAFGAGRNLSNFIYICISTAIGCGIIINGDLYRGANGAAGELSHIIVSGKNTLYTLASGKAIKDIFSIQAEELQSLYSRGVPEAVKAFDHLVHHLGIGIANVITLLNPEAVVIGGGVSNMGDFLLKPLETEVRKNAFSVSGRMVKILRAENLNDAGVLGITALTNTGLSL